MAVLPNQTFSNPWGPLPQSYAGTYSNDGSSVNLAQGMNTLGNPSQPFGSMVPQNNSNVVPAGTGSGSTSPAAPAAPATPASPKLPTASYYVNPTTGQQTQYSAGQTYDPTKPMFQWRDGSLHNTSEPGSGGSPTLANGQPNPNYFAGGPTTDVFGNSPTLQNGAVNPNWGQSTPGGLAPNPTPVSPFGPNPFMSNPGWAGAGQSGSFNPMYFPTQQTAQTLAKMIPGASVLTQNAILNAPNTPFGQNQPNYMVQLPNGQVINPGFIADLYNHGYSQQYIDQLMGGELNLGPNGVNLNSTDPIVGSLAVNNGQVTPMSTPGPVSGLSSAALQSLSGGNPLIAQQLIQGLNGVGTAGLANGASTGTSQTAPISTNNALSAPSATTGITPSELSQIAQLYGANPYSMVALSTLLNGGNGLGTLGNQSSSMANIATLLNLVSGLGGNSLTSGGVLNPLFWGPQQQSSQANYFPSFY